mmetsp:Transcript_114577/g.331038  ORF Transcript_114577/g.331038 Transcript_114577/m.331038 type:complete len:292 (-) Transcript_114577:2-877(-)
MTAAKQARGELEVCQGIGVRVLGQQAVAQHVCRDALIRQPPRDREALVSAEELVVAAGADDRNAASSPRLLGRLINAKWLQQARLVRASEKGVVPQERQAIATGALDAQRPTALAARQDGRAGLRRPPALLAAAVPPAVVHVGMEVVPLPALPARPSLGMQGDPRGQLRPPLLLQQRLGPLPRGALPCLAWPQWEDAAPPRVEARPADEALLRQAPSDRCPQPRPLRQALLGEAVVNHPRPHPGRSSPIPAALAASSAAAPASSADDDRAMRAFRPRCRRKRARNRSRNMA